MAKATKPKKTTSTNEVGGTGTLIFNGFISDKEYRSDLKGQAGLKKYDEMRRSDATVRATLQYIILPILRANWFVEPADTDDPQSIEIAEFVENELFHKMEVSWTEFLREALLHLVFGHYAFEKVFALREDGSIGWKKFAPRLPETIQRWSNNGVFGIEQQLPEGKTVFIPGTKLLVFVNEKEGDNYLGISILRSAFKHFYIKDVVYKVDAMAIERQGLGIPVITTPPNATPEDESLAEDIVANIRANEKSFARIKEGWILEFMDSKGTSVKDAMPTVMHHDRQIAKNILAQFMEIGAGSNAGGYSQSQDQSKIFLLSEESVATYIAEILNKDAVRELVDLNYNVEEYPTLKYSKISQEDSNMMSQAIQRFAQSGVLTPTPSTEDHIRDIMGLPEVTETERAEFELKTLFDKFDKEEQMMQGIIPMQQGKQVLADDKEKSKEKDKKEEDKGKKPFGNEDPQQNPMMSPEKMKARQNLKGFILDKKIEIEQMKENGTDITMEYVSQVKQEFYAEQKKMEEVEIPTGEPNPEEEKKADETLKMHERVNNAIENLESK